MANIMQMLCKVENKQAFFVFKSTISGPGEIAQWLIALTLDDSCLIL